MSSPSESESGLYKKTEIKPPKTRSSLSELFNNEKNKEKFIGEEELKNLIRRQQQHRSWKSEEELQMTPPDYSNYNPLGIMIPTKKR